jgi:hypothetical protein
MRSSAPDLARCKSGASEAIREGLSAPLADFVLVFVLYSPIGDRTFVINALLPGNLLDQVNRVEETVASRRGGAKRSPVADHALAIRTNPIWLVSPLRLGATLYFSALGIAAFSLLLPSSVFLRS